MRNQIELRHLRYFLQLSEVLHYRKAAENMYISQSALSKQIIQLEKYLNVRLFDRDTKNVALTESGQFFKEAIQGVTTNLDHIFDQVTKIEKGDTGELHLGFVGSAMQNVIPEVLVITKQKHPGIVFYLDEMSNNLQIQNLLSGKLDIGFVRLDKVPSDLTIKPIFTDTFSLVLPQEHKINSMNRNQIVQLSEENFILFDPTYSPQYYNKIMSICSDLGFTPQVSHNSVHASTIFRLVENNMGVSIIPTSLASGFDLKIKCIELKGIKQRAVLSVAWNKKNRNPCLPQILQLLFEEV